MSKDITDVDEFTSPIHVPEGIDSRDHAAEDVESIAQRLANRTHNLNTHVAWHDRPNTFTGVNTFKHSIVGDTPDPEEPLLVSHASPADVGSNWRLIQSHRHSVAAPGVYRYTRLYVGANPSDIEGNTLIGVNAVWNKTSALWQQDHTGSDSTAIIWHRGKLRISRVAAGTAPWPSWPTAFAVGQAVAGGGGVEVFSSGDIVSNTTVRANIVSAIVSFDYVTFINRTFPLDLAGASGDVRREPGGAIQVYENLNIGPSQGQIAIPLRIARDSHIFGTIDVMIDQNADAPDNVVGYPVVAAVLMRNAPNWDSTPPVEGTTSMLYQVTAPATEGVMKLSLPTATAKPDYRKEYQVVIKMNMYSRLLHVRVNDWEDFGPRNVFAGA